MAHKILIADDDQLFVEMLRDRLESSGFEVVCAYEGVRAVEKAHSSTPDLILLDWMMPAGGGGNVLESLARKDDTRRIPIIIVTGVEDEGMNDKATAMGVKAIIRKPYDPKVLLAKIREIIKWQEAVKGQ